MKKSKNFGLWLKLSSMPEMNHWPNRPEAFDYKNSQVIHYIMRMADTEHIRYGVSLFNQAKSNGCILFNPETKLWTGNPDWAARPSFPSRARPMRL